MKVIKPVAVTDSVLVSSTVPLLSESVWTASKMYALGEKAQLGSRIYQSLQASNVNHSPVDSANSAWWTDLCPSNRWAMFDSEINTQSIVGVSSGSNASLVVSLMPGYVNSIALLELVANSVRVEVFESASATSSIYDVTISLIDDSDVLDWYSYFFDPVKRSGQVHLENLPPVSMGLIKVTLSGVTEVRCGSLVVGNVVELGDTRYGASVGINDFSRKSTNDFGVTTLVKRSFSKKATFPFIIKTKYLDLVYRTLSDLRSTPCLWIGISSDEYTPTVIFGFYKDFSIDLALREINYCNLSIEGMI